MYEEVPEESEQLKLIYSMYADTDNSLGDIVRYLNEHQIKNLQDAETKKQAKEAGVDPAMLSTVSSRGRIAIANASSSSRQAKLCRIEEVDFFNLEQEHVDFTVTVNGIDVVRMTEEEMRRFRKLEKGRCAAPSFFVTILWGGVFMKNLIYGRLRVLVVEANTQHTRLAKVLTSFDDIIIYGNYVQIVTDL